MKYEAIFYYQYYLGLICCCPFPYLDNKYHYKSNVSFVGSFKSDDSLVNKTTIGLNFCK